LIDALQNCSYLLLSNQKIHIIFNNWFVFVASVPAADFIVPDLPGAPVDERRAGGPVPAALRRHDRRRRQRLPAGACLRPRLLRRRPSVLQAADALAAAAVPIRAAASLLPAERQAALRPGGHLALRLLRPGPGAADFGAHPRAGAASVVPPAAAPAPEADLLLFPAAASVCPAAGLCPPAAANTGT
jgi:hypothetical protein